MTEPGDDPEPTVIASPLSQRGSRRGVAVRVEIDGDSPGGGIVGAANLSQVGHAHCETDQQALAGARGAFDDVPPPLSGRATDRPLN